MVIGRELPRLLLAAVLATGGIVGSAAANDPPNVAELQLLRAKIDPAVVRLSAGDPPALLGNGVVVGPEGWILTGAALVAGRTGIRAVTHDNTVVQVEIKAIDTGANLALLKGEPWKDITVLPWAEEERKPGDRLVTIDSETASRGRLAMGTVVASTIDPTRFSPSDHYLQVLMPINAAWNIGTGLFTPEGGLAGLFFTAVRGEQPPAAEGEAAKTKAAEEAKKPDLLWATRSAGFLRRAYAELRDHGAVFRATSGLETETMTASVARANKLRIDIGVLVKAVADGSPGAAAGLKPKDVIIRINGIEVREAERFTTIFSDTPPKGEAKLLVWRGGKEMNVTMTANERPAARAKVSP